ncbi:MAG: metallophosphoesterase [Clostridia bacterium]
MAIFAISDLHLAFGVEKPMDVFGYRWQNYMERIEQHWRATVTPADTVLIPGDISWAISFAELEKDIQFIESLPGQKIISKGNHDYWWETTSKLNKYIAATDLRTIRFQYNNAFVVEDRIICGTRGWRAPSEDGFTSEDQKIHARELIRFEMSLQEAVRLNGGAGAAPDANADLAAETPAGGLIAMLHYPPLDALGKDFGFFALMLKYGVQTCIYGHIHGENCARAFEGELDGMMLKLVSADHLDFKPFKI